MNRFISILCVLLLLASCSQHSKGVTNKREFSKKKPPSVKIAQDYDKKAKKYAPKTYKSPKRAERARKNQAKKHKKKGDRYLKRQQRKAK